jgi:hypothetical protein
MCSKSIAIDIKPLLECFWKPSWLILGLFESQNWGFKFNKKWSKKWSSCLCVFRPVLEWFWGAFWRSKSRVRAGSGEGPRRVHLPKESRQSKGHPRASKRAQKGFSDTLREHQKSPTHSPESPRTALKSLRRAPKAPERSLWRLFRALLRSLQDWFVPMGLPSEVQILVMLKASFRFWLSSIRCF